MPRAKRICFPGAVYHIIQRGNNKQNIFLNDVDRLYFLKLLREAKTRYGYYLYCYALMDNHFHMTIETPSDISISEIMHFVEGRYASLFNNKHRMVGHLFQSRFKSILVEKEAYLLELSRYIHLNPVKAGYVISPEQYLWSSYKCYIGSRRDSLVNVDYLLSYFSDGEGEKAGREYGKFVEEGLVNMADNFDWIDNNAFRKYFLGSKEFVKKFQKRCLAPC